MDPHLSESLQGITAEIWLGLKIYLASFEKLWPYEKNANGLHVMPTYI